MRKSPPEKKSIIMKLNAYIAYPGTCEEAMNFYAGILGGTIGEINYYDDSPMASQETKGRILHTDFSFGDGNMFMACDAMGQEYSTKGNVTLSIGLTDVGETERIFREMSAGGIVNMPLEDAFWGAKFGMFTDKFGINWMVNCELPE